jgi:ABC-type phosphate/phosphonate transport system permease subunit
MASVSGPIRFYFFVNKKKSQEKILVFPRKNCTLIMLFCAWSKLRVTNTQWAFLSLHQLNNVTGTINYFSFILYVFSVCSLKYITKIVS